MAAKAINSVEECKKCIDSNTSFVLQGGAGSGKTESLKELLLYLSRSNPNAKVMCITHTNVAVQEIQERTNSKYNVSTIHSFLHELIKDYKKNIKSVISKLFLLSGMERKPFEDGMNEVSYKKDEHDRFKKIYGKYADKLFAIKKETCEKVTGKKDYDQSPEKYNSLLNERINELNKIIEKHIKDSDYSKIHYNETKFDSYTELTYGHDGLLTIFHLLFEKYPILQKMIADKYDYIFIDEYQDTKSEIICDFLTISKSNNLTVCLFGDTMQSIYSDGIGNVDSFINDNVLKEIPKAYNFRCSYEVLDIINPLRFDNIVQEVALAQLPDGQREKEKDRHGQVDILYSICSKRPTSFSKIDEKDKHQALVDGLVFEAKKLCKSPKILMLTNKAIAKKNSFENLYKVFDERYIDVGDHLENQLRSIQALDISDICQYYISKDYNSLIRLIRNGGYIIHTIKDKTKLKEIIEALIYDENLSLKEAFDFALNHKLIKQTEMHKNIINRNHRYIKELSEDTLYQEFKILYENGNNTFTKIKSYFNVQSEEEFEYYEYRYKKEKFIKELFSPELKFKEVLNYTNYLEEKTEYITMHKTKGSSIKDVIVVMEEFFWNEYDFSLLYNPDSSKLLKLENSQKLIYVACSRARRNLVCVRLIEEGEENAFLSIFPTAKKIDLKSL